MTHNALRITSVGIAVAALALISLSPEAPLPLQGSFNPSVPSGSFDPTVPRAATVFAANDGRAEGNVEDRTY